MKSMKLVKCLFILCLFSVSGCYINKKATKTEETLIRETIRTDTVRHELFIEVKPVFVPGSKAQINLIPERLNNLTDGASFIAKQGTATAIITKRGEEFEFIANCDSISMLLEKITESYYHYRSEADSLQQIVNKEKNIIINEPTGLQWFQIWGFRVMVLFVFVFFILKILLRRFSKIPH